MQRDAPVRDGATPPPLRSWAARVSAIKWIAGRGDLVAITRSRKWRNCAMVLAELVLLSVALRPAICTPRHTVRGVIPFCDTPTMTFAKPKRHYPLALVTLGDHLLKKRLDLGYTRKLAASQLGVDPDSLKHWEGGKTELAVGFYPRLIAYLGYNPLPQGQSRGQRIRRERISRGLSRKALADSVGVDEATIKRMEENVKGMAGRAIRAICDKLDVEM